jgi:lipopolysaccharide biosynthesis protein
MYSDLKKFKEKSVSYQKNINESIDNSVESNLVKQIAFYLPQFHTIDENNRAWGEGFTEWTNVTRAIPQFEGHYQPHLPDSLGFYDLKYPDVMYKQAKMARDAGIHAFCFYYYYFDGKTLLETPLKNFLKKKDIDINFCLSWANENWTKRWDGLETEVIIKQTYDENFENFIKSVLPYFKDKRYLKIDNKPVLNIYRKDIIPDLNERIKVWNEILKKSGFDGLYLLSTQSFGNLTYDSEYFEGMLQFPPHNYETVQINNKINFFDEELKEKGNVYDYTTYKAFVNKCDNNTAPCIFPSWDNTARKSTGNCFVNYNKYEYSSFLVNAYNKAYETKHKLLLINAWNEWAEGAHLEPDRHNGFSYLNCHSILKKLTGMSIDKNSNDFLSIKTNDTKSKIAYIVHVYYEDIVNELLSGISKTREEFDLYVTVPRDVSFETYVKIFSCCNHAKILHVDNKGRDILPWLKVNSKENFSSYEAVCKLHTKKTIHNPLFGAHFRSNCYTIISSTESIDRILNVIRTTNYGLITPTALNLKLSDYIGSNLMILNRLVPNINQMNVFSAGSMFWYKPDAMTPILNFNLNETMFESEPLPNDGTLAHAIERLTGWSATKMGYNIIDFK